MSLNKRFQVILVFLLGLFLATDLFIEFFIVLGFAKILNYTELLVLLLAGLLIVYVAIILKIRQIASTNINDLSEEFNGLTNTSIMAFSILSFIELFAIKGFFINISTFNIEQPFTYYIVINMLFLTIPLTSIFKYYFDLCHTYYFNGILELKSLFIEYAMIGPITTIVCFMVFSYFYQMDNHLKLVIIFPIPFLLVFLMFLGKFIDDRYKIFSVILFKNSQDEKTNELIKSLYSDPEKLQSYISPLMMKIAGIINIIDSVILIPIVIYIFLT